ncbi:MAG: hypothetical protein RR806_05635 [Oscillospiraceae bacterium]
MKHSVINETTNEVVNIIETDEKGLLGLQFPLGFRIIDSTNYEVKVGDFFVNNVFLRKDQPIPYIPTINEQLSVLNQENNLLKQENKNLNDLILEMSMEVYK